MSEPMNVQVQWVPYPGEEYTVIAEVDADDIRILGVEDEDGTEYPGMLEVVREDDRLRDRIDREAMRAEDWRNLAAEPNEPDHHQWEDR